MATEDYVSYEVAKRLKAAGFDWPCGHYYCAFDNETDVRFWSVHPEQSQNAFHAPEGKVIVDAPTLWQAQKWLRAKGFEAYAIITQDATYEWGIYHIPSRDNIDCIKTDSFKTYEDALSAGIARALELIDPEN